MSSLESPSSESHTYDADRPRPLPLGKICNTVVIVGGVSFVAQFLNVRAIHGVALIVGFLRISTLMGYHAWKDNGRTKILNFRKFRVLLASFSFWLPFALLLLPGVLLTLFIDDRIDALLRFAEVSAAGTVEAIDVQIEETVQSTEKVQLSWWWPPDWFKEGQRIVLQKVKRTVQQDVLRPASIWIRVFFSAVYAVSRVSQLLLYSSLVFIALRSYLLFLARSALYCQSDIEFTLP